MEYVYKLDYPQYSEVFDEKFLHQLLNTDSIVKNSINNVARDDYVIISDTKHIFKKDYQDKYSYNFNHVEIFRKINGFRGMLHRDSVHDTVFPWAINWVLGGTGIMEYYDESQLTVKLSIDGNIFTKNHNRGYTRFYTNRRGIGLNPIARYVMPAGVYLVNASTPHVPSGYGDRTVISLRSNKDFNLTWAEVVDIFTDDISML